MLDLLFKNTTAVTMDDNAPVLQNVCIGVKGKTIEYIGAYSPELTAKRVINGTDKVLIPALFNCHTHVPMSLLRGFAGDLVLEDWLFNHIFPAEQKFTEEMPYIGAMLSIAEMVASGTVSFTDMYFGLPGIAKAVAESGVKANLSNAVVAFDRENFNLTDDICYIETISVLNDYCSAYNGRIHADAGIHAEYTSFDGAWRQTIAFAMEKGLRMHIHLSETKTEHDKCKATYGMTPTQLFHKHRLFDVPTTAAHGVWLEDSDMDILAETNATVTHNPVSNLKLASGVARVHTMLQKGVNVTLGTDGMASNNSHDMFEEIKLACILQKTMCNDPTVLPAYEALKMATINGAVSQGRQNECGMLRTGLDADIVMLDFHSPRQTVCFDPVSALAYSVTGRDVAMTMCQGRVLYENGEHKTIDIEKVMFEAKKAAKALGC